MNSIIHEAETVSNPPTAEEFNLQSEHLSSSEICTCVAGLFKRKATEKTTKFCQDMCTFVEMPSSSAQDEEEAMLSPDAVLEEKKKETREKKKTC